MYPVKGTPIDLNVQVDRWKTMIDRIFVGHQSSRTYSNSYVLYTAYMQMEHPFLPRVLSTGRETLLIQFNYLKRQTSSL